MFTKFIIKIKASLFSLTQFAPIIFIRKPYSNSHDCIYEKINLTRKIYREKKNLTL